MSANGVLFKDVLIPRVSQGTRPDSSAATKCDLVIDGSTIMTVEPGIRRYVGETIDVGRKIVIPGMVDTHTHMWESMFRGRMSQSWGDDYFHQIKPFAELLTPAEVYASTFYGALECINNGVTTVFDYFHCNRSDDHMSATIDALADSGIRAVVGIDLHERVHRYAANLDTHPKRLAAAENTLNAYGDRSQLSFIICLSEFTPDDLSVVRREIEFARNLGLHMAFHCDGPDELTALAEVGLLGTDILPIHGNFATDGDLRVLGSIGGFLSIQPQVEVFSGRRSMSIINRAHRAGVQLALGVDVPALASPGLLDEMRATQILSRSFDGQEEREVGRVPVSRRRGTPTVSAEDILQFATTNGANAVGLKGTVGRVAPEYQADLVVIDTQPFGIGEASLPAHLVMSASNGDVDSVMVAGKFLKKGGTLCGVDATKARHDAESARDAAESRLSTLDAEHRRLKSVYAWGGG